MELIKRKISKLKGKYDVVNAQDPYSAIAASEVGFKTILTAHGYLTFEAISKGSVLPDSRIEKELLKAEEKAYTMVDGIVTVDTRIKDYISKTTTNNITSIKNFIDVEYFNPDKSKKDSLKNSYGLKATDHLIFVPRRLTKKNGVIHPLKSMKQLLKLHPNAYLFYAGTGEEFVTLENYIKEHKLSENVKLLGAVEHKDIINYYTAADVILVPSVFSSGVEEATSISALEAMGSYTPLIAGAVGGLKEIVEHEKDGILLPEDKYPEFHLHISRLLTDIPFAESLLKNAREKIEKEYSHISATQSYLKAYQSIL
jgi:glycosyltransferase involved in cell wall biosynthesis